MAYSIKNIFKNQVIKTDPKIKLVNKKTFKKSL